MTASPISNDVFCFVQHAQVLVADWSGNLANDAGLILQVIRSLPRVDSDLERAVVGRVLCTVAQRFTGEKRLGAWASVVKRDPIVRLSEMVIDDGITLRSAALRIGCSRWHLSRIVRQRVGMTFTEFVHLSRVCRAISLLAGSYYSVKEISAQIGYRATGELDRQFAKLLKMRPTQLRRAFESVDNLSVYLPRTANR
jgi:AraC-like DNA-binding protein